MHPSVHRLGSVRSESPHPFGVTLWRFGVGKGKGCEGRGGYWMWNDDPMDEEPAELEPEQEA